MLIAFMLALLDVQSAPAQRMVLDGLAAMGGADRIRAVRTIAFDAEGYRNAVEQSERPEGPYIVAGQTMKETLDFEHGRRAIELTTRLPLNPPFTGTTVSTNDVAIRRAGGREGAATPQNLRESQEALELHPLRVLLTALAAPDLRLLPRTTLQGVPHDGVAFTWRGAPVRVRLNANTHLPTSVEWVRNQLRGSFWSIWGDVTTTVTYSSWIFDPSGIRYPMQADVVRNGLPDRTLTISALKINAPMSDELFAIGDAARAAFVASAADDAPPPFRGEPDEIAPGVVLIRGNWYAALVRVDEGLVVLEAPISSAYSARVLAEAERRFPNVPVIAVVSTSDAWPHIGGLREYAARGIPIHLLDLNQPLVERLLASPHTMAPDALARAPKRAVLKAVSQRVTIGSGPNRIELIPIRGETTERQMMAWLPERRLLYGSDAFQQQQDGAFFMPQTVSELAGAVARERLAPERYFLMHISPAPWQTLTEFLKTYAP